MEESVNKLVKNIKLAKLMLKLVKEPGARIDPEINSAFPGGYHYRIAEKYLGKSAEKELEVLADKGLLKREFFIKEISCPKDSSINLSYKRKCPNCKSTNLTKKELLEHLSCDYIGFNSDFKNDICPKCGRKLGKLGVDYVKHGMQYVCGNCQNFFNKPADIAVCLKDNFEFPIEEAKEVDLYSYKVTKKLEEEILKAVDQQRFISEKLKQLSFKVESSVSIRGRSGLLHDFFMIATTGIGLLKTRIIVELLGNGEITEHEIFNIFARATDIEAYGALIGAIPKMTDEAKAVADSYRIAYVEGEELSDISEKLVHKFAELIVTPEERMVEIFGKLGGRRGEST